MPPQTVTKIMPPRASLTETKTEPNLFTSELVIPIALTACLIRFYMDCYVNFHRRGEETNYTVDPYKECWWSGPVLFSIAYLALVFGGKRFMDGREPMQIAPYMFWYNVYQCILNLVCVVAMLYEVYDNPHYESMWGNFPQEGERRGLKIAFWVWVHYNNKYVELLDTVFMIVRKSYKQLSFLHCYHHLLLIWSWFLVVKVGAGGDSYFGGMVNSFIHVIMYAYYTMPIIGIKVPIFIKRKITLCQKLQFCICLIHAIYVTYHGNCPLILPLMQAFVMINMLILFTLFSRKAYSDKVPQSALKPTVSTEDVSCPAQVNEINE
jgi:elongation of very long chain fatty acids protein 4